MKTVNSFAVIACAFLLIQGTAHGGNPLDLKALVQEGLENNPEITAYRKKAGAMWERPSQAAAWEDPEVMLGVSNVPADDADFGKIDMTMKEISLTQKIPFPGIPSLNKKVAVQEAKISDRELEYAQLQIARQIKDTYAELFMINAQLMNSEKHKNMLETFVAITRAKYEVGTGLQQDILKAQVEHSKFVERIIEFEQKKKTAIAKMNRLLGRSAGTPLEGDPDIHKEPFPYSVEELETMALENNPMLISFKNSIERSEAEYCLAKKMYIPSFNVTAAYGIRENNTVRGENTPAVITNPDGSFNNVLLQTPDMREKRDDVFSVFVGMNVPLWFKSKQNRRVAETHLLIDEAKAQQTAFKNDILFKIRDLAAKEEKGAKLIDLYQNGIVPQAAQSLESAITGYKVGNVDFLALLDSQVTLCTYEVQISQTMSEYAKDVAELELVVGKRLF